MFWRRFYEIETKFDNIVFILGQQSGQTNEPEERLSKGTDKMREPDTSENGSRNKAVDNVSQENGEESRPAQESPIGTAGEGSKQATSTRKPNSGEENQITNGNTEAHATKSNSERNEGNTEGNTILTKPNENSSGQSSRTKPNQNTQKITNYPVITDTTPQEPKLHPGREDNQIPKSGDQYRLGEGGGSRVKGESPVEAKTPAKQSPVGQESPVIEEPLQPKVHKIAPETRLPGEFTSQPSEGSDIILKTKQHTIRSPFSKLLDSHQRDEIRHFVKPKN